MLFDVQAALADIMSDPTAMVSPSVPVPLDPHPTTRMSHPPACAICGKADWTVVLTDIDGRRLHVGCWKETHT